MRLVDLKLCDLKVSRLIFGTASLFTVGTPKERKNLLFTAIDLGFTHFDTAPYYGFGLSERDLAPVLKSHPNVSFTTKVGIYSPGGENQGNFSVLFRKVIGRIVPKITQPTIDFSVSRAKRTLDESLKRTGRDTVDIYTLHEPQLKLLKIDEWQRWLEDCKSSGKVRQFGIDVTAEQLKPFLEDGIEIGKVIQLADSLDAKEADLLALFGRPMQITYGYESTVVRSKSSFSYAHMLSQSLKRNRDGAIIVGANLIRYLPKYSKMLEEEACAA